MARRQKKQREEHTDESWLLPYADMLTLLLALFIILFASSTIDATKYQQIMTAFNQNFQGGTGIIDYPVPVPTGVEDPSEEQKTDNSEESKKAEEREDLNELKEQIDEYIGHNELETELETNLSSDGLLLTIVDNALFHSGSADVREDALGLARSISELLVASAPRKIVVAGHTDDVPIHNAHFRSNWDLSSLRALNFMKILLDNERIDPRNLSATGYGEYHPVDTNDTEQGRARNRRVEVLIMPKVDLN